MYDEEKEEPIVEPDTNNATHFHPEEAPDEKEDKFKKFHLYNTGLCNGRWTNQTLRRKMDNLAIYDAISSQLELTEFQKRRGRTILDNLNLKEFGIKVELVAFCLSAIVARADGRIYHPQRDNGRNDAMFVDFADSRGYSESQLRSCYNRLSDKVDV